MGKLQTESIAALASLYMAANRASSTGSSSSLYSHANSMCVSMCVCECVCISECVYVFTALFSSLNNAVKFGEVITTTSTFSRAFPCIEKKKGRRRKNKDAYI